MRTLLLAAAALAASKTTTATALALLVSLAAPAAAAEVGDKVRFPDKTFTFGCTSLDLARRAPFNGSFAEKKVFFDTHQGAAVTFRQVGESCQILGPGIGFPVTKKTDDGYLCVASASFRSDCWLWTREDQGERR
jgi:hypothetical protein